MTEEQYDEFLDSLNEEEVNEIIRSTLRGIKKVATMGTAASRADRSREKPEKAKKRAADLDNPNCTKNAILKRIIQLSV